MPPPFSSFIGCFSTKCLGAGGRVETGGQRDPGNMARSLQGEAEGIHIQGGTRAC